MPDPAVERKFIDRFSQVLKKKKIKLNFDILVLESSILERGLKQLVGEKWLKFLEVTKFSPTKINISTLPTGILHWF